MGRKKHPREAESFRSKHGSPLCERLHDQTVQQLKYNVSHHKIAKNFCFSSSTVHNNIKRFRESGDDLWALRWHCFKNRYASVVEITAWAQEQVQKPLSVKTARRCKIGRAHV